MKFKLDSHTHTIVSGHAYNTILEMAGAASRAGLELLAITEHAPAMPGSCKDIYFYNLKVVPRQLFGIEVLFGTELNIIDYHGNVDLPEKIARKLDVCIASLHTPCISPGTISENTAASLGAMDLPYVSILGHPDDGRYPVDFETLASAAAEKHVLLEVNNHSLDPGSSRENARENILKMLDQCKKYRTHIIVNSDAHWCGDIGVFRNAESVLKEAQFPEELIINRDTAAYKKWIRYPKEKEC